MARRSAFVGFGLGVAVATVGALAVWVHRRRRAAAPPVATAAPPTQPLPPPPPPLEAPPATSSRVEELPDDAEVPTEPPPLTPQSSEESVASAASEDGPLLLSRPRTPTTVTPTTATQLATLATQRRNRGVSFRSTYEVLEPVGRGAFSQVFTCRKRATSEVFAVKVIDVSKFRLSQARWKEALFNEVNILASVKDHPNIIRVIDCFDEADDGIFIVTEYCEGGELFDQVAAVGNFTEACTKAVMLQAVQAVAHLHDNDIVHRDLKPENMLLVDRYRRASGNQLPPLADSGPVGSLSAKRPHLWKDPNRWALKLSDFGTSRILGVGATTTTFCGSPQYVAPEVLMARDYDHSYGKPVDVWSLGVILYVMLCGYLPFDQPEPDDVDPRSTSTASWETAIKEGRFHFQPPVWTHVSEEAKDLIRRMLVVDPASRHTARQCLQHPWFTEAPAVAPTAQLTVGMPSVPISLPPPKSQPVASPPRSASETLAIVAKSLDLHQLLTLQQRTAAAFSRAYTAVTNVPGAAMVVRRHAVACRDLQQRVRQVMLRFSTTATSVVDIIPDLKEAVLDGNLALTQALFAQLKVWIGRLRADTCRIQDSYSNVILDLQMSLEQARVFSSGAHNHLHTHTAARPSVSSTDSTTLSPETAVSPARGDGGDLPTPDPALSAGEYMDLFLNTTSVVSDYDRLSHMLQGGVGSPTTPPAWTAPSAVRALPSPTEPPVAAAPEVDLATFLAATPLEAVDGATTAGTAAAAAGGIPAVSAPAPPTNRVRHVDTDDDSDAASAAADRVTNSPLSPLVGPQQRSPTFAVPTTNEWMPGLSLGAAAVPPEPPAPAPEASPQLPADVVASLGDDDDRCLGCALEQLVDLDSVLGRCVDFFGRLELVVELVVQRKEHTETLLQHTSSDKMGKSVLARLDAMLQFWQAFGALTKRYSDFLTTKTPAMYRFLGAVCE